MRKFGRKEAAAPGGRSQRQLRVGEELRHALDGVLREEGLRDPDLEGVSITVSEVRVSPDLKNATAFIMPLGGAKREAVLTALKRTGPWLRARVAEGSRLRHAPTLRFELDTAYDTASRIDGLLQAPAVRRDLTEED